MVDPVAQWSGAFFYYQEFYWKISLVGTLDENPLYFMLAG